jgi:hypothetical protein
MQGETPSETSGTDAGLSLGKRAVRAFERDLPALLQERPGQWVLYHGDERIMFAEDPIRLYQEMERRSFRGRDCAVECIEEPLPDIIDSPYPFD